MAPPPSRGRLRRSTDGFCNVEYAADPMPCPSSHRPAHASCESGITGSGCARIQLGASQPPFEGRWRFRRRDGTAAAEGEFAQGRKTGEWYYWNEQEILIEVTRHHHPNTIIIPDPEGGTLLRSLMPNVAQH